MKPIVVTLRLPEGGRREAKARAVVAVVARTLRSQAGRGTRGLRFDVEAGGAVVEIDSGLAATFKPDDAFHKAVGSIPGVVGITS